MQVILKTTFQVIKKVKLKGTESGLMWPTIGPVFYIGADHLLIRTTEVRIGLPSTLLLASRTKTGAVRRTAFGPFRKRINSDPDYLKVAF